MLLCSLAVWNCAGNRLHRRSAPVTIIGPRCINNSKRLECSVRSTLETLYLLHADTESTMQRCTRNGISSEPVLNVFLKCFFVFVFLFVIVRLEFVFLSLLLPFHIVFFNTSLKGQDGRQEIR